MEVSSGSVAVTGLPMSLVPVGFSSRLRVGADSSKTGRWLALVLPKPEGDQPPSPSSLCARTCTS